QNPALSVAETAAHRSSRRGMSCSCGGRESDSRFSDQQNPLLLGQAPRGKTACTNSKKRPWYPYLAPLYFAASDTSYPMTFSNTCANPSIRVRKAIMPVNPPSSVRASACARAIEARDAYSGTCFASSSTYRLFIGG